MKQTEIFKEAKRLYNLGFAIHWLHPKSKRPVESGWTTGPRKNFDYLTRTYIDTFNLGVRLGEPSKIGEHYLCVVDVDVKSTSGHHRGEALQAARDLIGLNQCPEVRSGRGNGSRHYYCLTDKPFKTFNPAQSAEFVKVQMPSKKPSKKELETLTEKEIASGVRIAHAWEISLYSDGRQVVLPPSIHPDSGEPYSWTKALNSIKDLPVIKFEMSTTGEATKSSNPKPVVDTDFNFVVSPVDLEWLPISEKIRDAIIFGEGVKDRSGYLLPAATALVSVGLSQNEVLTVLTDPETFLGACGYDHAKTSDRARAAYWVYKYTLARVQNERSAEYVFKNAPPVEDKKLSDSELETQNEEMKEFIGWERDLERTPKDFKVKNTMKNCKLILSKVFGEDCIRYNEFANIEELWGEFPWVTKRGKEVHDIDIKMVKDWFTKEWGYEPSEEKIITAMSVMAFENKYHPVKQWLGSLPQWDEKDRIDNLLKTYIPCEGDDELRAVVGRRFMVALIKRIFEPGCQSDYLMVLEGLQGIHKSSAFRALIGDEWFSDASFNVEDKDAVMVIFSKWLIEFGELSTLDRATAEHTKAFITRRMDRIRAPFDRKARDYPRQCLFVGSTNKDEYLKDDSGNRRYWPFKVDGVCQVEKIKRDREQLFAEALYYYDIGEVTYLKEPHLEQKMKNQQAPREMHDVLIEQVAQIINNLERAKGGPLEGFQIIDLFSNGKLGSIKLDQYGTQRIATALRKLGYVNTRSIGAKNRRRIWVKTEDPLANGHDNHNSSDTSPIGNVSFETKGADYDFH